MAKQEDTKELNEPNVTEKSKTAMQQRGFFADIGRDIKNIGVGIAALPAHFATNPLDMAGKTAAIVLSSLPVVGGFVAGAYAFKSSYRETGGIVRSAAKAIVSGVIAGTVPGAGGAIVTGLVTKNIGEQIEQNVNASVKAGIPKTTISAVRDKYKEAGINIQKLRNPEKRREIGNNVKDFFSAEGIKKAAQTVRETIGPLTEKGLEKQNEKMAERAKNLVAVNGSDYKKSKIEQKIDKLEEKVKKSSVITGIGQLSTHIQYEAREIRNSMREKIDRRKEKQHSQEPQVKKHKNNLTGLSK